MAVANLTFPRFKAFDDNGKVLNGGTVTVYTAGTTTKTTIWTDADKSATLSNPVTLDSNGEAEIWFEGPVKVVLEDSAGTQQFTFDDIQSDIPPSDVGRFNLLENGSFELDSDGDNQPDDWTITEDDATSTVEIDTTNVSHGANSLKFVSQGSGGGTATSSDFFEVNAGKTCVVAFTIKSTVADVRNQVQVRYFDKDQTFVSADTVYDEDTSNPTSFEEKRFVSSVPASATYAKLRLIGCDPSDATSGTTYFDDVKVFTDQQAAVYSDDTTPWQFSGTGGNVTVGATQVNGAISAGTSGVSFPNVNANVTSSDEELNKLDGVTATTAELNKLDGITGSITTSGNDGPIYTGWVDVSGPTLNNAPSGWSVSKQSTGIYRITHNLGLTDPKKLICAGNCIETGGSFVNIGANDTLSTNSADAHIFNHTTGGLRDDDFQFFFIDMES